MKMVCDNCKHYRCGPFEYTDGALSCVLFPGGYIAGGVAYNFVTDWQGNVRQVVDSINKFSIHGVIINRI